MLALQTTLKGNKKIAGKFRKLGKEIPKELERTTWRAVYLIQKVVKGKVTGGNPLNVRTGRYRSSIIAAVTKRGKYDFEGSVGSNVLYGPVHEYGKEIFGNMRFKIGDRWITTSRVIIPARPHFGPAMKENERKVQDLFDKCMGSLIKKTGLA